MPLTQAEIAQAINNMSAIHTLSTTAQLGKEERQKLIDLVFFSLERWDMSSKTPEDNTLVAEEHSE